MGSSGGSDFWFQLRDYYERGLYCDLELLAGDSGKTTGPLKCHQLILASVSKSIRSALRSAHKSSTSDDPVFVSLPEFSHETLRHFLNAVYEQLVKEADPATFVVDPELEKSLELRVLPGARAWVREDVLDGVIEHQVRQ